MRIYLAAIALTGTLLAGCNSDWDPVRTGFVPSKASDVHATELPHQTLAARSGPASFASLPDRGELLRYDDKRQVERRGAYSYHPVEISEAHALNAIAAGGLHLTTPDGKPVNVSSHRIEEHPDGNWTWVGQSPNGDRAVLTFGERAVFGEVIADGKNYRLTMRGGSAWLVETDLARLAANPGHHGDGPGFLIPPSIPDAAAGGKSMSAAQASVEPKSSGAVVDVLLGYTPGMVSTYLSESAAVTRVTNLVAIGNGALERSGVNMRLRLVHAMLVNFPDNTDNVDALRKLTGYNESNGQNIPTDPAFNALRAARDQYGADLVSLVRPLREPEQKGCGIAWLIGASQRPIVASDERFGYSVVGDGSDLNESDGNNYFCSDFSLVHELAHNMGQAHNQSDSQFSGAHPYSYGYRETASNGFFTIMAYPLANSSQSEVGYFATPLINFAAGRPYGVANTADNVRSLNQTMPIVAGFRATVVPLEGKLDLYGIYKMGASGKTEVFGMGYDSNFTQFTFGTATGLFATGADKGWNFQFGDYNSDGKPDLFVILKNGASGTTEVHILNGEGRYQNFMYSGTTPLGPTGTDNRWVFKVGDYNRDGKPDIYAIQRMGASGKTEVHVLNGADNYKSFLAQIATALVATGNDYLWDFALGDYNGDGSLDLFIIYKNGASNRTEVHILSGASGFQQYILNRGMVLYPTGNSNAWNFKVGDYNLDGRPDIYAIYRQGASGRTEVFVMNGADQYQSYLTGVPTVLYATGSSLAWEFELAQPN